jgi:hypothetical protein
LTGDKTHPKTKKLEMLLEAPPEHIEHITIVRQRKKATNKEFNQALRSLRQDAQKLNMACSDAQRKAGLAVSSVEGFQSFMSRSTFDPETMSIARWRWLKAGRRVILQNAVAAVTRRLERYSMNDFPGNDRVSDVPGGANDDASVKKRRMRPSASATKLPSIAQASRDMRKTHVATARSRITRGSRDPRPLDDFSATLSGMVKTHAEALQNNRFTSKMGVSSSVATLTAP